MILQLSITFAIEPGPVSSSPSPAPREDPRTATDRPLWRQLVWPWSEDYDPDLPTPS
jgi:hypothetical protein